MRGRTPTLLHPMLFATPRQILLLLTTLLATLLARPAAAQKYRTAAGFRSAGSTMAIWGPGRSVAFRTGP